MPKVAAVVLLYSPPEEVLSHVESYREGIDHLYVVDNTENRSFPAYIRNELLSFPYTSLIHGSGNIGVAKALNLALAHARKDGYEWLLTMDQDSCFDEKEWLQYMEHFEKLRDPAVALVSPLHNPKFLKKSSTDPYVKKEMVLSSGNLVNVGYALKTGGYNEALFIDEVDHAFCFELRRHGYNVLEDRTVFLNHMLGRSFGKYGNIKLYPPIRLYYMLRNYLYLEERYRAGYPDFFRRRKYYLLKFFMKQLLFGKERRESIKMLKRGYTDHKNSVYGKYHEK